ncbi:hypothetical protein FRB99_001633 [Tulasnella sp. 403]|nr:hypothetical protein FRB99_001633 [Tulasnella sp. 403]
MRCVSILVLVASVSAAVVKRNVYTIENRPEKVSNAARFAGGLPPLPPKRSKTERSLRPRQSSVMKRQTGVSGTLRIDRTDVNQTVGFVSRTLDQNYGWFVPTNNTPDYLSVTIPTGYSMGSNTTTQISLENLNLSFASCSSCEYLTLAQQSGNHELGAGRPDYVWLTAGESSLPDTGPQYIRNSRSGGGLRYASESNVWSVASDGTLHAQWVNDGDHQVIPLTAAVNQELRSELSLSGDFGAFQHFGERGRAGPNTPAVPVKFTFVPANSAPDALFVMQS